MTADAREACIGAEVGEPVPGEPTCDRDDGPCSRRGKGLQKGLGGRCPVAVEHDRAALVEDADAMVRACKVEAAVPWVRRRVQSP